MPPILRLHECFGRGTELQVRAAWRSDCLRCCKCDRILCVKRLNQIYKLPRDVLNTAMSPATHSPSFIWISSSTCQTGEFEKRCLGGRGRGGRAAYRPAERPRESLAHKCASVSAPSFQLPSCRLTWLFHCTARKDEEISLKRPTQ